jgi:prophage regulatory protein
MSKRLLRRPGVEDKVGFKHSAIYELIKRGEFPSPIRIGRSSFWLESEIDSWIERRVSESRATGQEG